MSIAPMAADPLPVPPSAPSFSLSATIELAKGILSRGLAPMILCSLVLLMAQVPPQTLVIAQVLSTQADEGEATGVAASQPEPGSTSGDEGADGSEQGFRGALREALLSGGPDPSGRTIALRMASNCFSLVWGLLVQMPITIGSLLVAIRIARGESPRVMDVLHGYRRLPAQWGAVILQYLPSMPVYAIAAGLAMVSTMLLVSPQTLANVVPMVSVGAAVVGLLLLALAVPIFIVATWIAIRLTFCVLPVVDPAMGRPGPVESFGIAWRISKGHVTELIVLFLIIFVVAVATALCCAIPFVVIGLPAILALLAAAWLLLMRRECPNAPELIARNPDGSWGLPSQRAQPFDPSASTPPDFRA